MRRRTAYIGYIFAILLFFLYMLFPSDPVISYLSHNVSERFPGFSVSAKTASPTLPIGLTLTSPTIHGYEADILTADYLRFRPKFSALWSLNKIINVDGDLYGGSLKGSVTFAPSSQDQLIDSNISLKDIFIEKISQLQQYSKYKATGIAEGTVTFNRGTKAGSKIGDCEFTVSNCRIQLTSGYFGITEIEFSKIHVKLELINQRLIIKDFALEGRQVTGTASGIIVARTPLEKSTINISGNLIPQPQFVRDFSKTLPMELMNRKMWGKGIPIRISGTIDNPNFAMG